MKKVSLFLLGLALSFVVQGGSAFAETPLSQTVNELVGTPYKWGGTTKTGFDCSGFLKFVYNKFGVALTRTSKEQAQQGEWVSQDDLRPGDLVFFHTFGTGISHAGVYVGNGAFAHAADDGVKIDKLSMSYYAKRYVTARRVLSDDAYAQAMRDKGN
ncbi:C40 family peptidase [Paenibacillus alginolyticus]|uniref:C40 family peptidase n=1 Tax=Paenibacillus alginolyticus TaxID=59839 RepID=A0ABT4GQF4_9BACL|nr:C40 family peptidase [Paenibacillus alginolyticus]MCY9698458.1 C40 family peptidase [Paenibacillus alginolyticus]MEC0144633.1 C40 family peptidase [Paenibacillus alginolyticus]